MATDCFMVCIYRYGDHTCVSSCVTVQKGGKKTSSRKNVNQIRRLAKCTHIYSKNVIYNRYNIKTPQTPAAHSLTQRDRRLHSRSHTHRRTNTDTLEPSLTHSHVWPPHVVLHSSGGIKSALTSTVSVMHTVGPNRYIIYKPNHYIKTTRFSISNKDNMNVVQTYVIL